MATPTTSDFLVVPINGTDLIAFYRGSNISRPLYLSYSNFLAILTEAISGGTKILLQTNNVDNPAQNVLNLIAGTGISLVATAGGVTISANSGTSFITAISDTSDIDLTVSSSTLSAALTTTGVTANTYGTGTTVPQITVDSKGRITGVTNVAITAASGTVTSVGVSAGTGITAFISGVATVNPTINITNSAPDQTVALTGGATIGVSGTYPNFTLRTNVSTNQRLLGRFTAGSGAYEEITIGTGINLSVGGVLTGTSGTPYTVNNGLEPESGNPNNFQLGGALTKNTTITTSSGNQLTITSTTATPLILNTTGSNQSAIAAQSSNGIAGFFSSTSGIAIYGNTQDNYSQRLKTQSVTINNAVLPNLEIQATVPFSNYPPLNNFGTSIDFKLSTSLFSAGPLLSNSLISKWSTIDNATRTSQFEIQSVNNGNFQSTTFTLKGTGQLQLNNYTGTTFDGTAVKALGVDASGNVITTTGGSGSSLNDTTGILFGGALSATIGGTTFSVTAGIGQIVTQTASISGVVTTVSNVTWSAVSGAAITNILTSQFTYVLVNSAGTVIQQTIPFTDAQYKTHIIIGILCHINLASVNLVTNAQNVAYEDPHRLVELITAFGPIKKTGLNIGPTISGNLRVNRTSGEAFKIGSNYTTDQFEPDVATIAAQTPAKLCRVHRDGSGGFIFDTFGGLYYDDIDPNQYDDGSGTLQPVGGSKWTIQRLFFFPNNPVDIICYYGTQRYNQFSEARANLEFETFDEATITAENAVFLGFLFVRNAATNLSLPTEAAFLQSGLFRGIPPGGGGSGGGGNSIGQLTSPGDVTTLAATAPSQGVVATLDANYKAGSTGVIFDGGGALITSGKIAYVRVPYKGTIIGWQLVADQSGSCSIEVKQGVFSPFPPITTLFSAALSSVQTNSATSLSYPVAAGDWFSFTITGTSAVTWVNLSLSITKII